MRLVGRNDAGAHIENRTDVASADGRGGHRRDEHRAVETVAGVADGGVAPGPLGRPQRVSGVRPAVEVGADLGADPLAERVADPRGPRRRDPLQQVAVGHPLRREGPSRGQVDEPHLGDVVRGERGAVPLEDAQRDQGVVEVVVLRRAGEGLLEAGRPAGLVPGPPLRHRRVETDRREVPVQRPPVGGAQDLLDALARDLLHRLAEDAGDRPAHPGAAHAVGVEPVCGVRASRFAAGRVATIASQSLGSSATPGSGSVVELSQQLVGQGSLLASWRSRERLRRKGVRRCHRPRPSGRGSRRRRVPPGRTATARGAGGPPAGPR